MWIQRAARVSAGNAWRIALVLAGLLAASLVYGEIGGTVGAEIALAIFLVVLVVAWPRPRARLSGRTVRWGGRRRRISELESELAYVRSGLDGLAGEREELRVELREREAAQREHEAEAASRAAVAAGQLAEARGQLAAVERARAAELERLGDELRVRTRAVTALERALEVEVAARVRAEEQLASAGARISGVLADDPGPHLVLVARADGYRLVARDGPAPLPGAVVELPGAGVFTVSKLGRSPLPGDSRRCACLGRPVGPGGVEAG